MAKATFQSDIDRASAGKLWDFGGVDYMNHGSYGACPAPVREFQARQRVLMLNNPIEYFVGESARLLEENRQFWAKFLNADPEGTVHVECATQGVNAVMKSLALRKFFEPGDEILITSLGYNACNNVVREIAGFTGAAVTVAPVPFPIASAAQVTEAVLKTATARTRLALIDHVTSETGLILPIADIVSKLKERGIETLVDGAHAPAHVPVDLTKLGAAFYTGNGHKWLCAAPGCAFLYVRGDFRDMIRPLVTSHGANDPNPDISAFRKTFAWIGTRDYTPWSTPKTAFETLTALHPKGIPGLIADNMRLVRYGQKAVNDALGYKPLAPDDMIGLMVTIVLPEGDPVKLRNELRARDNFVLQLSNLSPHVGKGRFLRLAAQAYNTPAQFDRLAAAMAAALDREKKAA